LTRADLKLPENKTIFILQGAGINVQRGAEELVEAMQFVNDALLLIVGGGDVIDDLKKSAIVLNLSGKVIFMDKVPQQKLRRITRIADFGLTLDKDTNLNYRYSLPNKLFDYIHAGLPVIASDLPEIRRIIDGYKIGVIIPSHEPQSIASVLNKVIQDAATNAIWKENLKKAAAELTWDSEREVLLSVFQNAR
jgi:glycosyltransferase involved in cell wall biosynthesis